MCEVADTPGKVDGVYWGIYTEQVYTIDISEGRIRWQIESELNLRLTITEY